MGKTLGSRNIPCWTPDSKSVEFTSHKRGNPEVCIACLPEDRDEPFMGGGPSKPNNAK